MRTNVPSAVLRTFTTGGTRTSAVLAAMRDDIRAIALIVPTSVRAKETVLWRGMSLAT
jgi:hypothetical protein